MLPVIPFWLHEEKGMAGSILTPCLSASPCLRVEACPVFSVTSVHSRKPKAAITFPQIIVTYCFPSTSYVIGAERI